MFDFEQIELIRRNFNVIFDTMIRQLAHDERISLKEFELRLEAVEDGRDALNETFDYIVTILIQRNLENLNDPDTI